MCFRATSICHKLTSLRIAVCIPISHSRGNPRPVLGRNKSRLISLDIDCAESEISEKRFFRLSAGDVLNLALLRNITINPPSRGGLLNRCVGKPDE